VLWRWKNIHKFFEQFKEKIQKIWNGQQKYKVDRCSTKCRNYVKKVIKRENEKKLPHKKQTNENQNQDENLQNASDKNLNEDPLVISFQGLIEKKF